MMKYKKYTLLEALSLMRKGKKMCMYQGHDHATGYYFVIESIYLVEHNGDGSIYAKRNGVPLNWIDGKKHWVIKKNYDGLRQHKTVAELDEEQLARNKKEIMKENKKGFFERIFGGKNDC